MPEVYRWRPDGPPRGVVHVAHGMGEHARRYDRVAEGPGLGNLGPRGMAGRSTPSTP
jgi:hypothetical protein